MFVVHFILGGLFFGGLISVLISFYYFKSIRVDLFDFIGFLLFFIMGMIFIILAIWAENGEKREDRAMFYITSQRIIKYVSKGGFTRRSKLYELNYDELSYFINYNNALEFVSMGSSRKHYYVGHETEALIIPKDVKTIELGLIGEGAEDLKYKIMHYLFKTISLVEHPIIADLYLHKDLIFKN